MEKIRTLKDMKEEQNDFIWISDSKAEAIKEVKAIDNNQPLVLMRLRDYIIKKNNLTKGDLNDAEVSGGEQK